MNAAVISLLVLAVMAANLPFLIERPLLVLPLRSARKSFWWRLLELVILYFVIGFVARLLEQKLEPLQHQHWEFYTVTASMFAVLAFPGFIWRYLWR
ncbi:MAG: DUF2818 family protein [Betaproteobacteria bacterium]|nr:DUF2818 family protein [Betaproteobacteria bacterium]